MTGADRGGPSPYQLQHRRDDFLKITVPPIRGRSFVNAQPPLNHALAQSNVPDESVGASRNCNLIVSLDGSVILVQTGSQIDGRCMDSHRRGNDADICKRGMRSTDLAETGILRFKSLEVGERHQNGYCHRRVVRQNVWRLLRNG